MRFYFVDGFVSGTPFVLDTTLLRYDSEEIVLADWVVAESKCCPFFDFHIDLENEGTLICLRLTGEEGVKRFMRAEFGIR